MNYQENAVIDPCLRHANLVVELVRNQMDEVMQETDFLQDHYSVLTALARGPDVLPYVFTGLAEAVILAARQIGPGIGTPQLVYEQALRETCPR